MGEAKLLYRLYILPANLGTPAERRMRPRRPAEDEIRSEPLRSLGQRVARHGIDEDTGQFKP
jgi:hypothetical protein